MNVSITNEGFVEIAGTDGTALIARADVACETGGSIVSSVEGNPRVTRSGELTTIVSEVERRALQFTWTFDARVDAPGLEFSVGIQNTGDESILLDRVWMARGSLPGFAASEEYSALKIEAGSWTPKSIEPFAESIESSLVGTMVTTGKRAVTGGFVTFDRHRGFVTWTRDAESRVIGFDARHELSGDYSQLSAGVRIGPKVEATATDDGGKNERSPDAATLGAQSDGDAATNEPAEPRGPGRLAPGETFTSEIFYLTQGNVFDGLESWADVTGARNHAVFMEPPGTGFYTWYYYREHVDEEIILSNARYLAANRDRLPVNYAHLDWGWQRKHSCGDTEMGEGFEHGLAWLTREVRELGFVPGIWLNAFMHDNPSSRLVEEQPELFQSAGAGPARFGEPMRNAMSDTFPGMKIRSEGGAYRIDPTAPGVADYLTDRYSMARDLGFGLVMLDFFLYGVWPPEVVPADPSKTWEEALREVLDVVREAIGDGIMLMGCGAPYEPMIGRGNFVRVANDISTYWAKVKRGCRFLLWQYFMHNRLWTNYADCISVRGRPSPYWPVTREGTELSLSLDEARFFVTVTGLSGSAVMIAEDMERLERERQDLLTLILPICDEGRFRPSDLFPSDEPRIIRRTFARKGAEWSVVAVLNWDDDYQDDLKLAELVDAAALDGSPPDDTLPEGALRVGDSQVECYHVYDLFADRYLGALTSDDAISGAAPHGARVFRVTPALNHPQLVGTTTHLSQGAVETSAESWNAETGTLRIDLNDLEGRRGTFLVSASSMWQFAAVDGAIAKANSEGLLMVEVALNTEREVVVKLKASEDVRSRNG